MAAEEEMEEDAERERRGREEKEKALKREKNRRRRKAHEEVTGSIIEYDPKMGRKVYTRFFLIDFSVFDINEECKFLVCIKID